MDYQYNINNYKQISADCDKQLKIYIKNLDQIIDTADNVFVFRAHNHIKKENDLVKWCKSISENTLEEVNFIFKRLNNRELNIKSSDGSYMQHHFLLTKIINAKYNYLNSLLKIYENYYRGRKEVYFYEEVYEKCYYLCGRSSNHSYKFFDIA